MLAPRYYFSPVCRSPRVLRTAIFSTGIARHVVDGRVAHLTTELKCIELRICRLTVNSFHSMRELVVMLVVHSYISRDRHSAGAPSRQSPAHTTVLRAYRMAQQVQKSYLSAATVPSSPEAVVLFRSSVDNEVSGGGGGGEGGGGGDGGGGGGGGGRGGAWGDSTGFVVHFRPGGP
jgi:uncharacterized membrane protein YgcG